MAYGTVSGRMGLAIIYLLSVSIANNSAYRRGQRVITLCGNMVRDGPTGACKFHDTDQTGGKQQSGSQGERIVMILTNCILVN